MESQPQNPEFRNNHENFHPYITDINQIFPRGVQWLSGRVLDWRPRGCRFEPQQRHCIVVL